MISKELFSEVINNQEEFNGAMYLVPIVRIKVEDNLIRYNFSNGCILKTSLMYDGEINIYELAHKCKEWFVNYTSIGCGYGSWYIQSNNGNPDFGHLERKAYAHILTHNIITLKDPQELVEGFTADTEPEAIFAACQWVLDNK